MTIGNLFDYANSNGASDVSSPMTISQLSSREGGGYPLSITIRDAPEGIAGGDVSLTLEQWTDGLHATLAITPAAVMAVVAAAEAAGLDLMYLGDPMDDGIPTEDGDTSS